MGTNFVWKVGCRHGLKVWLQSYPMLPRPLIHVSTQPSIRCLFPFCTHHKYCNDQESDKALVKSGSHKICTWFLYWENFYFKDFFISREGLALTKLCPDSFTVKVLSALLTEPWELMAQFTCLFYKHILGSLFASTLLRISGIWRR